MAFISEAEKNRRRQVNDSVIGTSAMEGVTLDRKTLALMRRFEDGDLTRAQLSAAIDEHVMSMLAERNESALPALATAGAA
jgi:hypothetical protein